VGDRASLKGEIKKAIDCGEDFNQGNKSIRWK
jgi:hypothetical protein